MLLLKLRILLFPALATLLLQPAARAQAVSTARRLADLQIGGSFAVAASGYTNDTASPGPTNEVYNLGQPTATGVDWKGFGAYVDFDVRYHYGLEADFHAVKGSDPNLYEHTYEIGPRYIYPVGRFAPYAKAMYGRGIFNFAAVNSSGQSVQIANLAFNVLTAGGGVDLRLRPGLNVRVIDYEYQHWLNFPPNKLSPQVISFGVAYHFHGGLGGRRY